MRVSESAPLDFGVMNVATESMDETGLLQRLAEDRRPDAVLIAGPTASGKSDLAVRVANLLDGAVVNADSMQVYKDLDLLTARPDRSALEAAPHYLFGHVDGAIPYSVGHWLSDVHDVISKLWAEQKVPVIVGGTGLYFRSLTDGLAEMPVISDETRNRWRSKLNEEGAAGLHRILRRMDPIAAADLLPSDGQRIARALEVMEQTGRSIREWQKQTGATGLLADKSITKVILQMDRTALRQRIARRFDQMMDLGALSEVKRLLARELDGDRTIMKAIGVPHLRSYLDGDTEYEDAVERAKIDSGRYAKRQDTWFRNQMSDDWLRVNVGTG